MTTTLTVRMDEELKRQFSTVVESVGLDAPTVVRMLAVQTVRDRAIPLSLTAQAAKGDSDTMGFLDSVRADWGEW
ncbi:MAG: type II toxin-antitoxin system RelB/DinJ family antitoxin [Bifidobacteriaceae bacterium]|jgi:DNA-damage-inducible protein J|nr:type II toxin-antitoxin system RelB/DinJ family antitoxin [Bifidobacteriaceae bacterium]